MGRTFISVRQGVNAIAARWERAGRKHRCGKEMARMAKMYSSEGFMGCNDPLESVLFSVMMDLLKREGKGADRAPGSPEDRHP